MGEKFQIFEADVDMARAFRQFQKADKAFLNDNDDSAEKHLERGLELLGKVVDHLVRAAEDVYIKASEEFDRGNDELKKSIDAYAEGKDDSAANHYDRALDHYDKALDLLD